MTVISNQKLFGTARGAVSYVEPVSNVGLEYTNGEHMLADKPPTLTTESGAIAETQARRRARARGSQGGKRPSS